MAQQFEFQYMRDEEETEQVRIMLTYICCIQFYQNLYHISKKQETEVCITNFKPDFARRFYKLLQGTERHALSEWYRQVPLQNKASKQKQHMGAL